MGVKPGLTFREENRLGVVQNNRAEESSLPKRDETVAGWRELHAEDLHNLHYSTNISRTVKPRREHVACMVDTRNAYRVLMGKTKRKRITRKT
jgi:hypothetical protein